MQIKMIFLHAFTSYEERTVSQKPLTDFPLRCFGQIWVTCSALGQSPFGSIGLSCPAENDHKTSPERRRLTFLEYFSVLLVKKVGEMMLGEELEGTMAYKPASLQLSRTS